MGKLEVKYLTKKIFLGNKKNNKKNLWALRGITFSVNDGEAIGILGDSYSGNDILIKIIAGLIKPTTGFITTKSNITYVGLQEILDLNISGIDNIKKYLKNSNIDSLNHDHILNSIVKFTELNEWIYISVENYSLSQRVQLLLGMALFSNPDIVLIDNVFGILDHTFYLKTADIIRKMKDKGISFIISDSKGIILNGFCERSLWIQYGEMQDFNSSNLIVQKYNHYLDWFSTLPISNRINFILKNQNDQINFNINSVYEKFKIEQYKKGYKRKDDSRMRKAFFSEGGIDPVYYDYSTNEKKQFQNIHNKKSLIWVIIIICILIIVIIYMLL